MKHLKITNNTAFFRNRDNEEKLISEITKEDILYLLDKLVEDVEFDMDDYEENEIVNPAQKIIYENLYKKLLAMKNNRTKFIDDSKQVYKEALEKYK